MGSNRGVEKISRVAPQHIQHWRGLPPEGQRIIEVGISALLVFLAILVAFQLTTRSLNGGAFEFMLELFPGPGAKLVSVGPENKQEIVSMKNQVKRLTPLSRNLQVAREHFLRALSHLYDQVEAEAEFGRAAQNQQYLKAEALSKRAEESWQLYLRELRLARLYVERYSRETGRSTVTVNVQLPE